MKIISLDTPPEPPQGSVVLDPEGLAWQHHNEGWLRVGRGLFFGGTGTSWPTLLVTYGSLTLIYTPETHP